jgi:hypothetical protein
MPDTPSYVVVGQAWVADGVVGKTSSTRRLVPGNNTVNITTLGDLTVTCVKGTTASVANGTAHLVVNPTACAEAAATTFTTTDTGTVVITVTVTAGASGYGQSNNTYSYSATDGGISNASVPISTNSCLAGANSFTGASQGFNVAAALSCLDMDWTNAGFSLTLSCGAAGQISVYGNITLISTLTITNPTNTNQIFVIRGTCLLTSNGCAITPGKQAMTSQPAMALTLADDLAAGDIVFQGGTFNSAGKTINCGSLQTVSNNVNWTLTNSTINCTSWSARSGIVAANGSTINVSGTGAFASVDHTYNIVNLNGTAHTITGNNTYSQFNLLPTGAQTITATGTTQTFASMTRTGTGVITIVNGTFVKTGDSNVSLSKILKPAEVGKIRTARLVNR